MGVTPFGKTTPHSTSKAQNDYNTLAFLFLVFSLFSPER
jgi:hypothetical protein